MTANTTTDTVTVTTTGRYKIAYYYTPQSVAQNNSVALFVNGAKNGNSVVMDMSNADSSRYVTFERNLSAGDTIAIRFDIADTVSFIASPSGDVAYMTVEQVSGNTPVIGQSVDFAQFRLAANTTAYSANADIPQGTTVTTNAGNIPVTSAGLINLTAGKTYRFDAQVALSNAGSNAYLYYGLYDTSNVRIPNSPTGVAASTELTLSGISSAPSFGFVYTPTTNQTVKFRTDGVGGSPLINSGNTYFTVTQLGSSAVTTYDGVARTNAITLGADYATTAGNIWQDTNLSISVPGSGTWEVGYDVTGQAVNNGGSSSMKVRLYDVTAGAAVANSERYVTSEGDTGYSPVGKGSASLTQFLTTTSSNIYRVQVFEEPGGNTNQHPTLFAASSLRYNQISGMLPATGQSVDFVHLKPTDQTGFGSGVDVDLSSVTSGNMTTDLSANTITLRAGKTYRLIANLRIYAGTTDIEYGWVNSSNTELVANTGRGHVNNDGGSQNGDSFAELIYTPSSDITVKVRGLAGLANGNFESRASTISVVQLGSTNVSTGVALSTITTALANNTLDNTNFTQTWNWSSLAAGTSGLTFANTVGGTTQNNVITIMGGNNAGVAASQLITLKRPDGTVIGSVSQNAASTVAFNTTSDERLKTNIVDTAQGLDSLLKIKVRDFAYKSDASGKIVQGFIAQELEETYPGAVTVGSDAVDAGGLLANPWQVDYAKLTPLLVKSVQELSVKVDAQSVAMNGAKLEGITALTQRVDTLTAGLTVVQGKVTDFTDALARVDLRIADLDARIKAMEGVKTATAAAPQVTNTTVNNTTVVEDKNQLGDTKISKGKIGVKVTFAKKFDTKPVIYITSTTGSFQYLLSDVTTEGFTVKLDNPAQFDVVFSWLAAERKDDKSVTTELDPTQPHQLNTQDIIPLTEKITTETPVHP
jgi:hypothetical protein